MDRVRLGIIGCGDIAFRSYLPAIQELAERVVLVAACDTDRARAERVKAEYGAEVALTDADQMLARVALDGVLILTPMVPHGALSIAALEAGKHVYVEKVMAVNMGEADHMVTLAEDKGLTLACAPSTILLPAYQRTKALIDTGEIGRVCLVQAVGAHGGPARWDGYTSDPTWFYRPGAGPLFDLAVYPVHILTQILGPVKRVTAFSGLAVPELTMTAQAVRGQTLKVGVDDATPMVLDFGDATFATVHAGYNVLSVRLPAMEFWGSEGSLTAPAFSGDEIGLWHQGDAEWQVTHTEPTFYDRLGLAAGLPHWLDCICEGKPLVNHGRHGRHVLDVLLSAQVSARESRAVEIGSTF